MKKSLLLLSVAALLLSSLTASAVTQVVQVGSNFFSPSSFSISLGDTVKWTWVSGGHTTTSTTIPSGATSWNVPMTSTSTTFTYVPTVGGTYNYLCTPHASSQTGTFTVCSGPTMPVVTSSTGAASFCQGSTYSLSTTAQTGATYQWLNGTTNVTGATASSFTPTASGAYSVKVALCGRNLTSSPFTVTVNPKPVPAFTQSHNGLSYTFTNTTSPLSSHTYVWTFSDGSPAQTTTNATRTFAAPGNYTITLKATNTTTTCSTTSAPLSVTASLGVGRIGTATYAVAPNPAGNTLSVNIGEAAAVQLTDLLGKVLLKSEAGKSHILDVSELPEGIYMLQVSTPATTVSERVLIKR